MVICISLEERSVVLSHVVTLKSPGHVGYAILITNGSCCLKEVIRTRCIIIRDLPPYYDPSPPRGRWWSLVRPPSHMLVPYKRVIIPEQ